MADVIETTDLPMTVTSTSPLQVTADPADTPAPAEALNGSTYTVGDRVQVKVRNPRKPLITGKVETL